jgi:hypothetical protein
MAVLGAVPLTVGAERKTRDWPSVVAIVLAVGIFAGLSIYLAYTSESDLEADATTHFLMARYALKEVHYFVSVWGRPLCTGAYALAARIGTVVEGRLLSRFTSLGLAFVIAATTYAIAKRQGFCKPALVVILLLAQPIFFLHSFSELTEIPFAVFLMLAFLAYQRRQFLLMAICTAMLPLGRPEGLGFIMMAAVALAAHRRLRWLAVLPIPFLFWSFAGWMLTEVVSPRLPWWRSVMDSRWLGWVIRNNPYSFHSMYAPGPLLSFVGRLPVLVSPGFFPFTLVGIGLALGWVVPQRQIVNGDALSRRDRPRMLQWLRGLTHEQWCEIWIALIPLSILVVHSILHWKALMGSNGELRYLVIVGPFFAILGARGWEWAWANFHWRAPLFWAGIVALAPISANFMYKVVPLPLYEEGQVARLAARWYRANSEIQRDFPKIMPTPPGVPYEMDISMSDPTRAVSASRKTVENPPDGGLLVWDPIYGQSNASSEMCTTQVMIEAAGWIHYQHFEAYDRYCDVYLSPKMANGERTRNKYKGDWETALEKLRLGDE